MEVLGFSAVVFRDGKSYSAWSPDLDVASQGKTAKKALENLKEALELHLECLSPAELRQAKKRQGTSQMATLQIPAPN